MPEVPVDDSPTCRSVNATFVRRVRSCDGEAVTAELTLAEWLTATQKQRDELRAYGKSPLPLDAGERHTELDKTIQKSDDAGRLCADAEEYLVKEIAAAYMKIRGNELKLRVPEIEAAVESEVSTLRRIVKDCAVTDRTLKTRIFAIQNQSRSR